MRKALPKLLSPLLFIVTCAHSANFAGAGFDEAAVLLLPGGPTPAEVRGWVQG